MKLHLRYLQESQNCPHKKDLGPIIEILIKNECLNKDSQYTWCILLHSEIRRIVINFIPYANFRETGVYFSTGSRLTLLFILMIVNIVL
jgi:hypothetical protein